MIKTNPLSIKDITELAKDVRDSFDVKIDECFPILDYIYYLYDEDIITISILENNDPYLDKSTPAIYNALENCIYLKESVIEEIENHNYRSNFTLAHELFHYIQNKELCFTFEEVEDRKTYEDPEWQADTFAGKLLLPDECLDNEDNEYLKNHFKVSPECVLTRKVKEQRRKNLQKKLERRNSK